MKVADLPGRRQELLYLPASRGKKVRPLTPPVTPTVQQGAVCGCYSHCPAGGTVSQQQWLESKAKTRCSCRRVLCWRSSRKLPVHPASTWLLIRCSEEKLQKVQRPGKEEGERRRRGRRRTEESSLGTNWIKCQILTVWFSEVFQAEADWKKKKRWEPFTDRRRGKRTESLLIQTNYITSGSNVQIYIKPKHNRNKCQRV